MNGHLAFFAALVLSGVPALASALQAEWEDLHTRCFEAVTTGERLNLAGLEDRLPSFEARIVEDPVLGQRTEFHVLRSGGRTVPVGIWGPPGGALEMRLLEYPTRAGFRAICEVRAARIGAPLIQQPHIDALRATFEATAMARGDEPLELRRPLRMTAYTVDPANPRDCAVVASFSTGEDGYLRSSVSEAAGAPDCGGPSLVTFLITPHGVVPPAAQPEGARQ
ncbi:MAG: hypothetical protein AAGA47_04710 [Pseudomonadota bacterium]